MEPIILAFSGCLDCSIVNFNDFFIILRRHIEIAVNKHFICPISYNFCFYKVKSTTNHPANDRNSLSYVNNPFCAELSYKSESYLLIDFGEHLTRNFLDHSHYKLVSKLYSSLFEYLVNRNPCKASIYQCLYLVTICIITAHVC